MKKIFEIIKGDKGEYSSKRFVGVLGALVLFVSMIYYNTDKLVEAVEFVTILALGFTTIDKFSKKNENNTNNI